MQRVMLHVVVVVARVTRRPSPAGEIGPCQ